MLEEVVQDQMPDDSHRRGAKKDIHRAGDREIHFNMTPLWYQIGRQLARCKLKTAYGSAHWKKPCRSSGTTSLFLPGQFPRLSGWCSRWAPRQAGSASQRSNSMLSHTKYFRRASNWIVSLYGPFFELAHISAIFPMYDSSM